MSPPKFLETYLEEVCLIVPEAPLSRLRALGGEASWLDQADDLLEVMESCRLGGLLFGFASEQVLEKKIAGIFKKAGETFLKNSAVDAAVLSRMRAEVLHDLSKVPGIEARSERRVSRFSYRGWSFDLKVGSLEEEVDLCLHCLVRGVAAQCAVLVQFEGEAALCADKIYPSPPKVEPGLVKAADKARCWAKALVPAGDGHSGDTFKALSLVRLDPGPCCEFLREARNSH